jgi:hypothetical protein
MFTPAPAPAVNRVTLKVASATSVTPTAAAVNRGE